MVLRSRLTVYWFVWVSVLLVTLAIRVVAFDERDDRFPLAISYMLGTWLPVMALNVYEGHRLMSYLREHHEAKWEELTYIPGFGPGGRNGFRSLPWLYSADTLGDPQVALRKREHRSFIAFVLTIFCTYPIVVLMLAF